MSEPALDPTGASPRATTEPAAVDPAAEVPMTEPAATPSPTATPASAPATEATAAPATEAAAAAARPARSAPAEPADADAEPYGLLRRLFFGLLVRPFIGIVLGLNVRGREHLPSRGPALIVANHNSHLDTLALMSLFPLHQLDGLRPVAAADYFLRNRALAWLALRLIGIIPIRRAELGHKQDPLEGCCTSLRAGQMLIVFPEGSRGEPERLSRFKTGIAHLAERFPEAPIHPIFMHGLGKALPKSEAIFVPFFCDVAIGEPLRWQGDRRAFMAELEQRMTALAAQIHQPPWE